MKRMHFDLTHHVLVAKVTKPQGVKGEIRVYPYSDDPGNFEFYNRLVFVDPVRGSAREIKLSRSRTMGKVAVLTLLGVTSRNDAEELVNCEIWVSEDEFPELTDNEYYWNDFKGMEVYTINGLYLGQVASLMSTGAHDILVVSGKGQEYMIPVREEFLVEVNEAERKIVVDPPEGLLEINRNTK